MIRSIVNKPLLQIVGLSTRTNLTTELNPQTAKIGLTIQQYVQRSVANSLKNRSEPGTTLCIYSDYESDWSGDYTYVIGEAVTACDNTDNTLYQLSIPAQKYVKFTNTEPGPMPAVCIAMWQKIWHMTPEELGGTRAYLADFELYDHRSYDLSRVILDIYIGIH